jgi:DNA polymerase-3 subunit delta
MTREDRKSTEVCKPVYVVVGKDDFLVKLECERLLDSLLLHEQRMVALSSPDLDSVTAVDVLDELRTAPFLAPRRVVVLEAADAFISENRGALERYFDSPSPCGVLIMTVSEWHPNTRLAKKLPQMGELITVADQKPGQLLEFLVRWAAEKHQKRLTRQAVELLVELGGDEPGRLCSELDKLAVFAGSEKTITAEQVETLVGHNRLFGAFEVIAAMTRGDTGAAVGRLRKMFATDKNAPYTVVGAFAYHFRRMFNAAKLLRDGMPEDQISAQLRVWYDKKDFYRQVRTLGLEKIGRVLSELAQIDYETKTGQATSEVAIEKLVFRLAGKLPAAAREKN